MFSSIVMLRKIGLEVPFVVSALKCSKALLERRNLSYVATDSTSSKQLTINWKERTYIEVSQMTYLSFSLGRTWGTCSDGSRLQKVQLDYALSHVDSHAQRAEVFHTICEATTVLLCNEKAAFLLASFDSILPGKP